MISVVRWTMGCRWTTMPALLATRVSDHPSCLEQPQGHGFISSVLRSGNLRPQFPRTLDPIRPSRSNPSLPLVKQDFLFTATSHEAGIDRDQCASI